MIQLYRYTDYKCNYFSCINGKKEKFNSFFTKINETPLSPAQTLIGVLKHIMLIKNLYNLFCGSEPQNGRSDCAPDVIEEKEHIVIIPKKFKDDVERLCNYCGVEFKSGLCIELPLKEIINICPRTRRRVDAYFGLVSYLKSEYGITLKITSNKTKI